jgi:hypothetical protein
MFHEIARLVALVLCMLSLCAVFHTAFLVPASDFSDFQQRTFDSLGMLAIAAGISLAGGLVFRESRPHPDSAGARLASTLPVQVFCWVAGVMLLLFLISWYLETHIVFYRDIRIWT